MSVCAICFPCSAELYGRGAVRPVAFAQFALEHLSGLGAWQSLHEIHGAWALESGERRATVADELQSQFLRLCRPLCGLDNRFDFFAELRVGHADHGHVRDCRMSCKYVFRFLRINV